jgi:hypothetical protein
MADTKLKEPVVTTIYDNKHNRHGFLVGDNKTPIWTLAQAKIEFNKQLKGLQKQAVIDSTKKAEIPDKLVTQLNNIKLQRQRAEVNKDTTSVKLMDKRIKQIESEVNKLDASDKSTDKVPDKIETEKSGVFDKISKSVSEWWGGSEEDRGKDAWIENHIAQDKEAFVNRELEVPPEFKSNPEKWYNKENKKRTNQWYKQKAEEAYAEEMKIKDPAGIADYVDK